MTLANALLFTAFILLMVGLNGCMTYQKAVRKFGHLAKDSTTLIIQDTVVVPKDSTVTRFKTDTTTFYKVIETVRQKLTIDRTPKRTVITAECKPDTIVRTIRAKCPPVASFGVAGWYKTWFYIMLAIAVLLAIIWQVDRRFLVNLNVKRK